MTAVRRSDEGFDFTKNDPVETSAFSFTHEKRSSHEDKETPKMDIKSVNEGNNEVEPENSQIILPNLTLTMPKHSESNESQSQDDNQEISNGHQKENEEPSAPCEKHSEVPQTEIDEDDNLPDTLPYDTRPEESVKDSGIYTGEDPKRESENTHKVGDKIECDQTNKQSNALKDCSSNEEEIKNTNSKLTESDQSEKDRSDNLEETQDLFASQKILNDTMSSAPNKDNEKKDSDEDQNKEKGAESAKDTSQDMFGLSGDDDSSKNSEVLSSTPKTEKDNTKDEEDDDMSESLHLEISETQTFDDTQNEDESGKVDGVTKADLEPKTQEIKICKEDMVVDVQRDKTDVNDDPTDRNDESTKKKDLSTKEKDAPAEKKDDILEKKDEPMEKRDEPAEKNDTEKKGELVENKKEPVEKKDKAADKKELDAMEVEGSLDAEKGNEINKASLKPHNKNNSEVSKEDVKQSNESREVPNKKTKKSQEKDDVSDIQMEIEKHDDLKTIEDNKQIEKDHNETKVDGESSATEKPCKVEVNKEETNVSESSGKTKENHDEKMEIEDVKKSKHGSDCCPCVEEYETKLKAIKENLLLISIEMGQYLKTKQKSLNGCIALLKQIDSFVGGKPLEMPDGTNEKEDPVKKETLKETVKQETPRRRKSIETKLPKKDETPKVKREPETPRKMTPKRTSARNLSGVQSGSKNKKDGVAVFAKWPNSGWYYPGIVEGLYANQLKESGSVTVCFYDGLKKDMKNINVLPAYVVPPGSFLCSLDDETEMTVIACDRENENDVNFTLTKSNKAKEVVQLTYNKLAIKMNQMKNIMQQVDQLNLEVVPKIVHKVSLDNLVCGRRSRRRSSIMIEKDEKTPKDRNEKTAVAPPEKPIKEEKRKAGASHTPTKKTTETNTPTRSTMKRRSSSVSKNTPATKRRLSARQSAKKK